MNHKTLDDIVTQAVATQAAPFLVAMVANAQKVVYCRAAGAAPNHAVDENSVFRLFSMTKAVGALAAMMLIDRRLLRFDTPVGDVIPAWDDLGVLEGFDGETLIVRPPRARATIRHLATHTSGLRYDSWHGRMAQYRRCTNVPSALSGRGRAFENPLMDDPGVRWGYGMGIDWLGKVVEAVDGRSIDVFCQQEIFSPLGMSGTAFEPDNLRSRLCKVYSRGSDGGFVPVGVSPPARPDFYGMGHALYSTPSDYLRFLRLILNGGELFGQRLMSSQTVRDMLEDQLAGMALQGNDSGFAGNPYPPLPEVTQHSFLANRATGAPGRRASGSQSWGGICNTHFWVDPASDIAAVFMTQTLPFMDPPLMEAFTEFERAIYSG